MKLVGEDDADDGEYEHGYGDVDDCEAGCDVDRKACCHVLCSLDWRCPC